MTDRTEKMSALIRVSAKVRIAMGMTMLVLTVLITLLIAGICPDHRAAAMNGRCELCELVALQIRPTIVREDVQRMDGMLNAIVSRNSSILSGAVRRADGTAITVSGDHSDRWDQTLVKSNDRQIFVPLKSAGKDWGRVEVCFKPLTRSGIAGILDHPWIRLIATMGVLSLLVFYFYLRAMLNHLDVSRAAPRQVSDALNTLGDGLLLLNSEFKIALMNTSLANSTNRSPTEMVGQDVADMPWQLTNSDGVFPWVRAIDEGRTIQGEILHYQDDQGVAAVFQVSCSPVMGGDDTHKGVLVSLDDVTELEETKQMLCEARDDADEANQAKSAFLANMSHEIRTPMNAILGFTEVLRRGIEHDPAKQQRHLNTIHSSGTHLLELINDILDLSKVEAGHLEVESIPCAVHQVIAEVATVLRVRAEQKGISLNYEFKGQIPDSIQSDPSRLRQILTNLIGNAIKFTDEGGVRVITSFSPACGEPSKNDPSEASGAVAEGQSPSESQIRIEIVDTGIGMTPVAAAKIFNPFLQADASVSRRFGGTGLGLSISKQLAEALGGGIHVTSEEGVGSVFIVTIDTGAIDTSNMIQPTEAEMDALIGTDAPDLIHLPDLRVLLVDDAEENRDLMSVILDEAQIKFRTAENGAEAMEIALSEEFDVILMDMNMPVMDGYTAAAKLRDCGYTKPIVALTAHAMAQASKQCREAGCTHFLSKPVDIDDLMSLLAKIAGVELAVADRTVKNLDVSGNIGSTETADLRTTNQPLYSTLNTDNPKLRAIVKKFVNRLPEQIAAMQTAIEESDFVNLADLAHWLKGSGPNVGFTDFADPAKRLEESSLQHNAADARQIMQELRALLARVGHGAGVDQSLMPSADDDDAARLTEPCDSTPSSNVLVSNLNAGDPTAFEMPTSVR